MTKTTFPGFDDELTEGNRVIVVSHEEHPKLVSQAGYISLVLEDRALVQMESGYNAWFAKDEIVKSTYQGEKIVDKDGHD